MQKRLLSVGKRGPRSFIGGTQVDLVVWQSRHLTSCRTEFLKELLNMLFVACFQKGGLAGLYSHVWRFIAAQIIHMKRSSPLICQLGIREYSCRDKDIGVRCLEHGMKYEYMTNTLVHFTEHRAFFFSCYFECISFDVYIVCRCISLLYCIVFIQGSLLNLDRTFFLCTFED